MFRKDHLEGGSQLTEPRDRHVVLAGGLCGIVGTLLYLGSGSLKPHVFGGPPARLEALLAFWVLPVAQVLFVINSYAIYRLVAWEREGAANRLSFLLSVMAYGMAAMMLTVQGTVELIIGEKMAAASSQDQDLWRMVYTALDGVDLGMDLAWDLFFGSSLMVGFLPMLRHSRLGPWWAIPALVLGILLIGLNASTVPWPPATAGLFDIGPVIGLYGLVLSIYMVKIGLEREAPAHGR